MNFPTMPYSRELKFRIARKWFLEIGFSVGNWLIGASFDVAPLSFGIGVGSIFVSLERNEVPPDDYDEVPNFSFTLKRFVIHRWKLEIRLEVDWNRFDLGYAMADKHDHGIYLGPFNFQIEYDKFYDQPYPPPEPLARQVNRAFLAWLSEAAPRLAVPVEIKEERVCWLRFGLRGINPAIEGMLSEGRALFVTVDCPGQRRGYLFSTYLTTRDDEQPCEDCFLEEQKLLPYVDALARDNLFEPFLLWVNEKLVKADEIALYAPISGWQTQAELLSEGETRRNQPEVRIPVKALG